MLKRDNSGFTIIEIIVTLLIIGVLLTVLLLTAKGIEQKEHNVVRISDIKLIQSHLETYYAENGFYPTFADMNNASWTRANLKGLDQESMIDPGNNEKVASFSATPEKNVYAYQPTASNGGSSCDNQNTPCTQYTLTTILAGGGEFTEKSLNQ